MLTTARAASSSSSDSDHWTALARFCNAESLTTTTLPGCGKKLLVLDAIAFLAPVLQPYNPYWWVTLKIQVLVGQILDKFVGWDTFCQGGVSWAEA